MYLYPLMIRALTALLAIAGLLIFATSCKKDSLITDSSAMLEFSHDTIMFDTVFTTVGSATNYMKVFNRHSQPIEVKRISFGSGSSSFFRMNVDGAPGNVHENVVIPAEDSIWIFVEVTIDPGNTNNPFIVADSLVFETNGNVQDVDLVAWGQDAHFYSYTDLQAGFPPLHVFDTCNMILRADKPHVFYAWGFVSPGCTLTVEKGARVHFHKNSGMWVYAGGTLRVLGTVDEPVIFEQDRLDPSYENVPGQWDRIWINQGSTGNVIRNAVIRNGFIGLQAEQFILEDEAESRLELTNVLIENMSGLGMLGRNYEISGRNVGVFNCGNQLLALTGGGSYDFRHCSFGNYWQHESRDQASMFLSNLSLDINNNEVVTDFNAFFGNCIVHGQLEEELEFDSKAAANFDYMFDHCIIKTEMGTGDATHYNAITRNPSDVVVDGALVNPIFENAREGKYYLRDQSIAIDMGDPTITDTLTFDIEGMPHNGTPDLGAFEKQ